MTRRDRERTTKFEAAMDELDTTDLELKKRGAEGLKLLLSLGQEQREFQVTQLLALTTIIEGGKDAGLTAEQIEEHTAKRDALMEKWMTEAPAEDALTAEMKAQLETIEEIIRNHPGARAAQPADVPAAPARPARPTRTATSRSSRSRGAARRRGSRSRRS